MNHHHKGKVKRVKFTPGLFYFISNGQNDRIVQNDDYTYGYNCL